MKLHTQQTAFNAALNGMRNQGYRQSRLSSSCLYLCTPDDLGGKELRCGVGHMMTEETAKNSSGSIGAIMSGHYDNAYDGSFGITVKAELAHLGTEFLRSCQLAHDGTRSPTEFELYMAGIARDYGLTYTAPEAV